MRPAVCFFFGDFPRQGSAKVQEGQVKAQGKESKDKDVAEAFKGPVNKNPGIPSVAFF